MKQKLKTKKAAAKRFKVTGSGKLTRRKRGMRHLLNNQQTKSKRQKRGDFVVDPADSKRIRVMLPGI